MNDIINLQTFGSVFVTLLVIMDPPGALPIFLALTGSLTQKQKVAAARRASLVALQLLTGSDQEQHADAGVNVALVPLGTPLLAGPGAIVATMLQVKSADGVSDYVAVAAGLVATMFVVWLFFRFASQVHRVLKDSGTVLVTRIAGLLLSAIAVQMVADSIRAFVSGTT